VFGAEIGWRLPTILSAPGIAGRRRTLIGRGETGVSARSRYADGASAVDVDVDEAVEIAVLGSKLRPRERVMGHEVIDDGQDRVAAEGSSDLAPPTLAEGRRIVGRVSRASLGRDLAGQTGRGQQNGASATTVERDVSDGGSRAATAASERPGR